MILTRFLADILQSESDEIFRNANIFDMIVRSYEKSCMDKILYNLAGSDVCFFDLGSDGRLQGRRFSVRFFVWSYTIRHDITVRSDRNLQESVIDLSMWFFDLDIVQYDVRFLRLRFFVWFQYDLTRAYKIRGTI